MLESVIISTLAGSLVCIMVLIFKNKILSLLGGKALYYISLLAMLIFVLPMNIGEITLPEIQIQREVNITEFNTTTPINNTNNAQPKNQKQQVYDKPQYNTLPKPSNIVRRSNPVTIQEILFAAWLLGFIVSMLRYFISYFRFKKKICNFDTHEKINGVDVIKSPLITSPMIFGFFKPTLAIPEIEMNEEDYNLAIKHEMVHYKHHDSWFKLFAVMVNSICWFNPITYFMVNLIGEACEYACDEQVTKEMNIEDKKQYSTMILSMVCQSSPALSSNMAKNKKQLKRRFEMIMKKKRYSIFKTAFCTLLILAATCGSVVLANEVAPIVSSLLKDDYVYISNYGNRAYNEFVPIEKNGVYYVPLREFLNKSDIENDKIKYDNGTITVDIWTNQLTVYSSSFEVGSQEYTNGGAERTGEIIPAQYSWSTTCVIGSKEVDIAGEKYTLNNAPYIEDGITYVPYEYLQQLRLYEYKSTNVKVPEHKKTSKFVSLMLFGFNSANAEYYTDDIHLENLGVENAYAHTTYNSQAKISKTGYRTEFQAKYDYVDLNELDKQGNISVKLNKVIRIYSKGSDIEGLFTVVIDGETIYDNEPGYIINLPIPAGEGVLEFSSTRVKIGELKFNMYFTGLNSITDEYNERAREIGKMSELPDTVRKFIVPSAVKLNGINVSRGSKMYSLLSYNPEKELIDVNIQFDNYIGNNDTPFNLYRINSEVNSKMTVIDENTISAELYLTEDNNNRLDSFDAIISFMPDGRFELKSTDGKYIIKGRAEDFIPQWQWTEEQKNAPVPQVVMIDE